MDETGLTGTCSFPCTKLEQIFTDEDIRPSAGKSAGITHVDGYRYAHVLVEFEQQNSDDPVVNLHVSYVFDAARQRSATHYVSLEGNPPSPQSTDFISVSGKGPWNRGSKSSSYLVRIPIMAPYLGLLLHNEGDFTRKVTMWVYLVA